MERIKAVIREYYVLICIIIGALVLYYPKLSLFFLSDDFIFLETFQKAEGIFKGVATYHFNPTTQILFYIMIKTFGLNPTPYHAITLLLHIINTTLVFILTKEFFKNTWTAALASILFTTYFMHYEVVYWVAGIYYILLTLFYLLAILVFIKFLENKQRIYYVLFLIFYTGAIFAMEQGVTLIAPCILYELIMHTRLKDISRSGVRPMIGFAMSLSQKYILPIMILVAFFAIKISLQQNIIISESGSWLFTINVLMRMLWLLVLSYIDIFVAIMNLSYFTNIDSELFYRILGFIMFNLNKYYLYYTFLLILLGVLCYYSGVRKNLYLFGTIMAYLIPVSISANEQARYFYLPSVFASIILANFVIWTIITEIDSKKYFRIKTIFSFILIVAVTMHIPVNIITLRDTYREWNTASSITRNIIKDTRKFIVKDKPNNIYFVNLPDALYKKKNVWPEAYIRAYIFRNGIGSAIRLFYPREDIKQIVPLRTSDPGDIVTWKDHRLIRNYQLIELTNKKDNVVLIYDTSLQSIRRVTR